MEIASLYNPAVRCLPRRAPRRLFSPAGTAAIAHDGAPRPLMVPHPHGPGRHGRHHLLRHRRHVQRRLQPRCRWDPGHRPL